MRYQQIANGSQYPYPDNNIPADQKGKDYCMAYAKGAYNDWQYYYPKGIFSNNQGDYTKYRMYALGKQPITPYMKMFGIDEQTNDTWLVNDWTVRSIISPYRDKAISRLMEQDYSMVCTPIDMLAKSEMNQYYSDLKAKLMVKQMIGQVNQELSSHPMITLQSGEPMDLEELEMRIEQGEQFNRSKDAEMAIELGMYENNYQHFRRTMYEDLFDFGVAGYKEWLGNDNKPKFRKVNPENILINYCRQSNFSDLVHAGEVIDVSLIELGTVTDADGNTMFTEKDLQEFAGSIAGRWGNPTSINAAIGWMKPYDKFKCKVLDIYWLDYNEVTYSDRRDANNNPVFMVEKSGRGSQGNPRYMRKKIQVVYKCKWIIGTDFCYDFGLEYDPKRSNDPAKKAYTSLPYKFYAYNFYEMKAQGFMERLVPFLDEYQLTKLKIQNWKNRAIPSGWWIDLEAMENVALNKGGKNMDTKQILQMFFETGILLGRSKDAANNPMGPNWKPIIDLPSTSMQELVGFYQDLQVIITDIERLTGYNDVTTGNPNPKTLVPGYEIANMSTQHALYPMKFAEKYLSEQLAMDILCRMQQGLKKGDISGYAPALNSNTIRFIQLSPEISLRQYGILVQEKTTDEQKMWILQQVNADIVNGFLDTSDAILIINTHNAKQSMQILAYRVKKAKEAANKQRLAEMQAQGQSSIQAAQIQQQTEMQSQQMQIQANVYMKQMEIMAELKKKEMEVSGEIQKEKIRQMGMAAISSESNESKEHIASVTGQAKLLATEVQGQHAQIKQQIANDKPQPPKSKK